MYSSDNWKSTKAESMNKIVSLVIVLFIGTITINAQDYQWAKRIGGVYTDHGYSIAVDGLGNVYSAGTFMATVDFDPGSGTSNLTTTGTVDAFISKLDPEGNFLWAKSVGGVYADQVNSIAVDGSGNVYITGYFSFTADFDPGAGTNYITSAGNTDVFVLKLDAAGNFIWAKSMGGTSFEEGHSIAVDNSGNVYTAGIFEETADFDPGVGTSNLTSAAGDDVFISKLDAAGNFLWAKSMGGNFDDWANSIALDAFGNVHTTGSFIGTVDFDPGTGTANLTSAAARDVFISKLDSAGNFVWAKKIGGNADDRGHGIAVDDSGNVYTTGRFASSVDFDPGAGTSNLTSAGSADIFISKLDAAGNFGWAVRMGGSSFDGGNSIAVDGSGNVHTTGYFQGNVDFDPGAGVSNSTSAGDRDVFISKLDAAGNFVWATRMGGTLYDRGYSIALDGAGNVYSNGSFGSTADFDPGAGTSNLTSAGSYDVFISKLNSPDTNPVLELISAVNPSCTVVNNGSIDVNAIGGTPPYTFHWTSSDFGQLGSVASILDNLYASDYEVFVVDFLGDTSQTLQVSLQAPEFLDLNIETTQFQGNGLYNVSCPDANDGAVSVSILGGSPPYNFNWSSSIGLDLPDNAELSNLPAGIYEVFVEDVLGCTASSEFPLNAPPEIISDPIFSDYDGFQISCADGGDGIIIPTISGGDGFVELQWLGDVGANDPSAEVMVNLNSGTYSLLVTDEIGCSQEFEYDLTNACIPGCLDPTSLNYNPDANQDSSFCQFAPDCIADLNGDNVVSASDLVLLLGEIGCSFNCLADLDGNGIVNTNDLILLLSSTGESCD